MKGIWLSLNQHFSLTKILRDELHTNFFHQPDQKFDDAAMLDPKILLELTPDLMQKIKMSKNKFQKTPLCDSGDTVVKTDFNFNGNQKWKKGRPPLSIWTQASQQRNLRV